MATASFPTTINARYSRITQNVELHVTGAIPNVIRLEFYNTLDEFLKDSNIWQEEISVAVTAGDATYTLAPVDGVINRLLKLEDANQIPVGVTMLEPGELVLNITPTTTATLTATVALTCLDPTDTNDFPIVPDWILDKYFNGFVDGIISKLMMHPSRPYTNQQLAIYHMRRFRNTVTQAISEMKRTNLYGAQAWSFPTSYAVRRKKA